MGMQREWWEAACCRLAHSTPHLVFSAEPCPCDSFVRMLDHGHARMGVRQMEGQGNERLSHAAKALGRNEDAF